MRDEPDMCSIACMARIHEEFSSTGLLPDPAQEIAIRCLGRFAADTLADRKRGLRRIFRREAPRRGIFLWGDVGRGKTVLLDAMARTLPQGMVRRYHQHAFLDAFHGAIAQSVVANDRFPVAVARLLGAARLLVIDELHAYDIADALILGRAFVLMQGMGVRIAFTANHLPADLWPKTPFHAGRDRHFDPLLSFILDNCDFLRVDGGRDYRHSANPDDRRRWWPSDRLTGSDFRFDFEMLCGGHNCHADYQALCCRIPFMALTGVPRFGARDGDRLRRLIWLLDVAWEASLPMAVTADSPLESLFDGIGDALQTLLGNDLRRTQSRLRALTQIPVREAGESDSGYQHV